MVMSLTSLKVTVFYCISVCFNMVSFRVQKKPGPCPDWSPLIQHCRWTSLCLKIEIAAIIIWKHPELILVQMACHTVFQIVDILTLNSILNHEKLLQKITMFQFHWILFSQWPSLTNFTANECFYTLGRFILYLNPHQLLRRTTWVPCS